MLSVRKPVASVLRTIQRREDDGGRPAMLLAAAKQLLEPEERILWSAPPVAQAYCRAFSSHEPWSRWPILIALGPMVIGYGFVTAQELRANGLLASALPALVTVLIAILPLMVLLQPIVRLHTARR